MKMRNCFCLLLAVLAGCTPWGYKEVDKLLDQKTSTVGSYQIQLNLHTTKGYGNEIWLWCQTNKTTDLVLFHQLGANQKAAAFTKTGWKLFQMDSTSSTAIPDSFFEIMFHPVNDHIAFGGNWNSKITFDACATVTIVYPDIHFKDRLDTQTRPGLEPSAKPFFKKFTPTADNTGGCFDVESLYLQDESKLHQLCTVDKGKTWFEPVDASIPAAKPPENPK